MKYDSPSYGLTRIIGGADGYAFLRLFAPEHRLGVASRFCFASVSPRYRTPQRLVGLVHHQAVQELRTGDRRRRAILDALDQVLTREQPLALAYANHVIAWRSLPADLREEARYCQCDWFREAYTEELPPSQGQLTLLARLGYCGPQPDSRLDASELIEERLDARYVWRTQP